MPAIKELMEMKKEIDSAKTEKARIEGQLSAKMQELKDEFDCDTEEQGEEELEAIGKNIDRLTKQFDKKYKSLLEKYNEAVGAD